MATPPAATLPPGTGIPEIERLRQLVGQFFPVYEVRVAPQSLVLLVHAEKTSLEGRFDQLRQALWRNQYAGAIRYQGGEYFIEVVRRPPNRPYRGWVNLALLAATIVTTMTAGSFIWLAYVGSDTLTPSDFLYGSIFFGLPVMLILGLHELAHYVVARRYHVEASLPFFMPLPPPFVLFGTFGAFISIREPIPSKRALLDIGAAGPLAGFAVAIPITIVGMFLSAHSSPLPVTNCGPTILGVPYGNLLFGTSFFWSFLSLFIPGAMQNLHPLAIAGWVGILVTAMNLLPAGQLDGGHVFRALFGDRSRYVSYAAVLLLFGMGFFYAGWFIFGILILVLGVRHPPPLNDITPLDARRYVVGGLAIAILIAGFVVVPISTPAGAVGIPIQYASPVAIPPGYGMAENITMTIHNLDPVAHGYFFTTQINQVTTTIANRSVVLTGSALAAFIANSTWAFHLPNGNTTRITGGNVTVPSGEYSSVPGGGRGTLTATYLNTGQGVVQLTVFVEQVCTTPGASTASESFTIS